MSANSSSPRKKGFGEKNTFQRLQCRIISTNLYVLFCKNIFYIILPMKLQYNLNSETSVCPSTLAILSICTTSYKDNHMQSQKAYACNSCPVKFHFSVCFCSNVKHFSWQVVGREFLVISVHPLFIYFFLII